MINWLHTFHPQPILLSIGVIHIYWYGFFMVLGIITAMGIIFKLAKYYNIDSDSLFDLSFWLIINGLIGARIYDIFLQLPYYINNPIDIFKVWQGGLAIHGAIIASLITVYFFARKRKISSWKLVSLVVPGLALAQAIGRFGNYFNQELFGLPTSRPWGIPIDLVNRPWDYLGSSFFHPTFLYESFGCLLIFFLLIGLNLVLIKQNKLNNYYFVLMASLYMVSYSILRFALEFIRIDFSPIFLGFRWPQIISLVFILIFLGVLIFNPHAKTKKDRA
jgi:phosphatidylglycerol:prolipoprotein diacylglycerol transferase